ncbi:MAG: MFS transporter [Candidatus Limnocylindrales bacterium]
MSQKRWTLLAAVLGSGIVFLDSTIVNVALPRIGQELPRLWVGQLEGLNYVYNAYLLSLSSLLILAGALNDYFGRRRMFLLGLVGFGATSALCGFAPNMELLILFRVLQGATGALLVPGSLSLLTATFSGEEQGRAFGIWAGASAATTILGPVIGGLLVDTLSWRAAFFINVPLVIVAAWATWRYVAESRNDQASGHFDWLGALDIGLAVGGLSFGLIYGGQRNWHDPLAFVALGVGTLALVAFPFLMRRRPDPLVPLSMFRSRNFTVTNISTFLIYGALYISAYYLPLFTQGVLGYTATAAGLVGILVSVLLTLFSPRFGVLAARFGPRRFMAIGPAVMALGLLWLARAPGDSSAWVLEPGKPSSYLPPPDYFVDFLPYALLFGMGLTIMVAPLTTALMTSVPVRNSGLASAINNAISRVGPQLAGAVIFVAITASFFAALGTLLPGADVDALRGTLAPLNPPPPGTPPAVVAAVQQASTGAFHLAMLASTLLLVVGAVVNWLGIRPLAAAGVEEPGAEPTPSGATAV